MSKILELAEPFGQFEYADAQGHKRIEFAKTILSHAAYLLRQMGELEPTPDLSVGATNMVATTPSAEPAKIELDDFHCGYARIKDGEYKLASMRSNAVMADGELHPIYAIPDELIEKIHVHATTQAAGAGEAVAWQDPETKDTITAERKADWETHFGIGGKTKASAYTCPLYTAPPPPAQQAMPEGMVLVPIRLTSAMMQVIGEEDWEWGDLLAAAEAVTEEEYEIAIDHDPSAAQQTVPSELSDALEKLSHLSVFLLGWRGSQGCINNEMQPTVDKWREGLRTLFDWYDAMLAAAPQLPKEQAAPEADSKT